MIISELIEVLEKAKAKFGDISVAIQNFDEDDTIYHINNFEYTYAINEKLDKKAFALQPMADVPYKELNNISDTAIVVLNKDLGIEYKL